MKNRLRELRLEKGLRQKDVAEKLGISPQSLGYYENGINKPDPDMLIKLADFFEISVDFLLGRENENEIIEIRKFELTNEEDELLQLFRMLSEEKKNMALDTVRIWCHPIESKRLNKHKNDQRRKKS